MIITGSSTVARGKVKKGIPNEGQRSWTRSRKVVILIALYQPLLIVQGKLHPCIIEFWSHDMGHTHTTSARLLHGPIGLTRKGGNRYKGPGTVGSYRKGCDTNGKIFVNVQNLARIDLIDRND